MHIPYHHPDMLDFLDAVRRRYVLPPNHPVRCVGDELDHHAMSFHDSDPDLMSAGDELQESIRVLKDLYDMFPRMDLVDSNHGSMKYRKAKVGGIPRTMIRSYNEVLEAPEGWKWHIDLTFTLPNGQPVYMCHGKNANVVKTSQAMGMCAIQGHYHEKYKISYWGNSLGLYWGMNVGCLIDDHSYAFAYNNTNTKRPVIGIGAIVEGCPILIPMVLKADGRWCGKLGHEVEPKKVSKARKIIEAWR